MRSRLFDEDPITGVTKLWHYDHTSDEATIETLADVENNVEALKHVRNSFDERARWNPGLALAGQIPLPIWADLEQKGIANDDKALLKWLDDPDNGCWRTRPGRLSR